MFSFGLLATNLPYVLFFAVSVLFFVPQPQYPNTPNDLEKSTVNVITYNDYSIDNKIVNVYNSVSSYLLPNNIIAYIYNFLSKILLPNNNKELVNLFYKSSFFLRPPPFLCS